MKIRIATRKSPLALWQANFIKQQLLQLYPTLIIDLVPIVTEGDIILDSPLSKIGGKGLFVKQLEHALLSHEADIAVHSIKDIPTDFPEGLILATICKREDKRDAFISNRFQNIDQLTENSVIGTSSLRRQCQLNAKLPFLTIKDLRGNVGTRLAKLDNNEYDGIILAVAGLKRLGLTDRITQYLDVEQILPAVGQGAIGIEARENDSLILELLAKLDDNETRLCVQAERAMNRRLQGGCQVPIACNSQLINGQLYLHGLVGRVDGSEIIEAKLQGDEQDAEKIGIDVADQLLEYGAKKILSELNVS